MAEVKTDENGVVKTRLTKAVPAIPSMYITKAGNSKKAVLKRVYDKTLDKLVVKKVDEIDIDEYIQASASSADLAILKKRILETGEVPQVDQAKYSVDYTLFPSDIHELFRLKEKSLEAYNKLDPEIQKLLTADEFFASATDGSFYSLVASRYEAANKKSEVSE